VGIAAEKQVVFALARLHKKPTVHPMAIAAGSIQ